MDSHAYVWWLTDDSKLSPAARAALADAESLVHVSAASIWELLIKTNLGRMDLGGADLVAEISESGFFELPISARHAERAANLPRNHDDPFDRMLAAQALVEGLTCVTRDREFQPYGVQTLW